MSTPPVAQDEVQDLQLSRLYRESAGPEPAPDLDQAILAAAHREVHARPRSARSFLRQWRVPASIAAVVVISASLVTLMLEEGGERLAEPPRAMPKAVPRAAPAPAQPDAAAPAGPAASAVAEPAARPDEPRLAPERKDAGKAADDRSAMLRSTRETAAAAQSPARDQAKRAEAPAVPPAPPRQRPAAPATAPQPFVAPPSEVGAARVETEKRPAARQDAAAPLPPEVTLRDGPVGRLQSAPRREFAEDSGAKPPVAPAAKPASGVRSFDEAELARPSPGVAIESPAARAKATAKPAPLPRGAVLARELVEQPPEKWLERVEQLRREDRHADADELLIEFRRRFPEYPIPTRLR